MTNPTDGMGVYESVRTSQGTGVYQPRLAQIAAGGFSLVLNYGMLFGHMSDLISYVNTASALGLKVIVYLADPAIWKTATYSTAYPLLYADAGNPSTGAAFAQYVVNQLKGLSGVWGWYIGDEPIASDHASMLTYANAIASADATHPRLIVAGGSSNTTSVSSGANVFYDCADVIGDDWYPIGNTQNAWTTPAIEASGVQSYATTHGNQAAMVLQSHSLTQYYPPARSNNWPTSSPWPTASQMRYNRDTVLANANLRIMLWYSYYNFITADDPGTHWNALCWAANGVGSQPIEPTILAEGLFYAYSDQAQWPGAWAQVTGTLDTSIVSAVGTLTGATDVNYILLGAGSLLSSTSAYTLRFALSNAVTGKAGLVFNWIDANNFMRLDYITNSTVRLVSVVNGVETVLGSGSYALGNTNQAILKIVDTGTAYNVLIYSGSGTIEPSTLFTVSHTTTSARVMRYGIYTQLASSSDTASIFNFAALNLAPGIVAPPVYYVSISGNDANPGTKSQPFATIQQAANVVVPGSKVYVNAGIYNGALSTPVAGTATQRIQFIATGGQVTIQTSGVNVGWSCIGNYIDLIGFNITGDSSLQNPVVFYGAFNTIRKCTIHDIAGLNAIGIEDASFPASDNQIIGCLVRNIINGSSNTYGIRMSDARNIIQNNLVILASFGITIQGSNANVSNNLISNCASGGLQIWGQSSTVDYVLASNNMILYCGYAIRETGTTGTNNQYLNTLVWQDGASIFIFQNGNTARGFITAYPNFVNFLGSGMGDYHLLTGSAGINAGTSLGAPSVDADNWIRPNPLSGLYDIGPYQQHITPNAIAMIRNGLALVGVRP